MKYDEINYWSEVKLDIIKEYASAYSRIISKQKDPSFSHIYIDAFAGAGIHISKSKGEFVPGSPLNALSIEPPFKEHHLIDLAEEKVEALRETTSEFENVTVYQGDCNELLLKKIFPRVEFKDYRRALCLLDPYGLHLNWEVIETAGKMKTIEIFLNFPVMDMNMNVLWRNPDKVDKRQLERMNAYWGDASWRKAAYDTTGNLFGIEEKTGNEAVVSAFQERLRRVATFKHVPDPIPMRNYEGATVYYLFFASHKPAANEIVEYIFEKYRNKGIA